MIERPRTSRITKNRPIVVKRTNLVYVNDDVLDADLFSEKQMLLGLWHSAVGRGYEEYGAVHLRGSAYHVLDEICVSRTVRVGVTSQLRRVPDVSDVDRYTASFLLGCFVDLVVRHVSAIFVLLG